MDNDYYPWLLQLQQLEEARINFMKYNLEKMMKHLSQMGTKITDQAAVLQESSQFVSSDTDLKLFISENKSERSPPDMIHAESFNVS